MNEAAKRLIRAVVPARVLEPVIRRFFRVRWQGDFASWSDARAASSGYETEAILSTVVSATRSVREGRAAFERDGVTFAEKEFNPRLLECLSLAAQPARGVVVVDFGGSLGSAYWQHREQIAQLHVRRWCVIEQTHLVEAGRREFEDGTLHFYGTLNDAWAAGSPDVVLLGGVVPYLEEPYALLRDIVQRRPAYIVVDRVGINHGAHDRLTVQHVPRNIYRASYPCWFLKRENLLRQFEPDYDCRIEMGMGDSCGSGLGFRHFVFHRRTS